MELFTYEHKGYTFCFRLLDTNIKTYDEGKHFTYAIPVYEKENKVETFIASFRLEADELYTAYSKTIEQIDEKIDKMS